MKEKSVIYKTESLCNTCLKKIPAFTFMESGKVHIEKECPQHGKFTSEHFWSDPEIYSGLSKIKTLSEGSAQAAIAVTYRCNLNCPTCYANANETKIEDMDIKDLDKLIDYKVIFLTGGDPTVRTDLFEIIERLNKQKQKVIMFTNGIKLADREYVKELKKSGLRNVILQFDTLNDKENIYIRGRSLFSLKLAAIKNMQKYNLPTYTQSVILNKRNFKEIKKIFHFAFKFPVIKAITFNPLWELGRYNKNDFVSSSEILAEICKILGMEKKDWTESTRFLCNLEKIISMFRKRKRVFGKCNLKCLIIKENREIIPITKIFDVNKINQKIELIYKEKNKPKAVLFLFYFSFSQIFLNFFRNRSFRILVWKILKNIKYLFKGEKFIFNPFHFLSINIFPTLENFDYNFVNECNFNAASSQDFSFEPACIHRIKALRKENNIENS